MFFNESDDLYVINAKDSHVKHSQRINKMYKRVKKQMRREQNNIRYATLVYTADVSMQFYMNECERNMGLKIVVACDEKFNKKRKSRG